MRRAEALVARAWVALRSWQGRPTAAPSPTVRFERHEYFTVTAAKENINIKPATVTTARVVGFQRISRSSEPKRKRTVRVPVHAPGPSAEREPLPTSTKPSASPVLKDGNTHARYGGYLYDVLEDVVL